MTVREPVIDVALDEGEWRADAAAAAVRTLQQEPATLDPVWFYDERGSDLFDEITRLPEYHLTRAERSLLERRADTIADLGVRTFAELGSGTSEKSRVLLDAMTRTGSLHTYVPIDVSEQTLRDAANDLVHEYPGLSVHGIVGDFHATFGRIPRGGRRLVAFLGSTIGNLEPGQRQRFLFDLDCVLDRDDVFLLGIDLVKDVDRLLAAYDDAAGVTAEFNRNALRVLNAGLGTDFDPEAFVHRAVWNEAEQRIEMWLDARSAQTVHLPGVDAPLEFAAGSSIRTEISSKFSVDGMTAELSERNFVVDDAWVSDGEEFALLLAHPYC